MFSINLLIEISYTFSYEFVGLDIVQNIGIIQDNLNLNEKLWKYSDNAYTINWSNITECMSNKKDNTLSYRAVKSKCEAYLKKKKRSICLIPDLRLWCFLLLFKLMLTLRNWTYVSLCNVKLISSSWHFNCKWYTCIQLWGDCMLQHVKRNGMH